MKTIINSDHAPKPVGPYSQAVRAGNTLYISGQVAIDPISNTIIKTVSYTHLRAHETR